MKHWKDIVGFVLLFAGVGGILGGIHGMSGGKSWGGPAIGAGAAANVLAYRVMRTSPTTRRTTDTSKSGNPQA